MEIVRKEIGFNGMNLIGVSFEEKLYIIIKNFCEVLGINYNGQLQRVKRDEVLDKGVCKIHIPSDGGLQETNLLELDYVPLWLAGIKTNQCREEVRGFLLEFKLKVKDILSEAFFGKRELLLPGQNQERYEPELNEIEDRAARIRKNRDIIRDILVKISIDYEWIKNRAGRGFEKTKLQYKESKKTYFVLDGKEMSVKEIDALNPEFERSILRNLSK